MANITSLELINVPASGYYVLNDQIQLRVNFSSAVNVTGGPPGLKLNLLKETDNHAVCGSPQANVTSVTFTYTVSSGDTTADQLIEALEFDLAGGTITDSATTDPADLTIPDSSVGGNFIGDAAVEGNAPEFSVVSVTPEAVKDGTLFTATISASAPIVVSAADSTPAGLTVSGDGVSSTAIPSADGTLHTLTATTGSAMPEGTTRTWTLSGYSKTGYSFNTSLVVPLVVDRTPPQTTNPTITKVEVGDDTVTFSWDAAIDTLSDIEAYEYEIQEDLQPYVSEQLSYAVGAAPTQVVVTVPDPKNGCKYRCRVRAVDRAGNAAAWSAYTSEVLVNTTRPECIISTAVSSPTNVSSFDVSIRFAHPDTGLDIPVASLDLSQIVVVNGAKGDITTVDGANYTLKVHPTTPGSVSVRVLDGAAYADSNGLPNTASGELSVTYDPVRPTCVLSGPSRVTCDSPIKYTATFSKPVTGVTVASFTVTGASVSLTGQGALWFVELTPNDSGPVPVTIQVNDQAGTDEAGNKSYASNPISVSYDGRISEILAIAPADDISAGTIFAKNERIRVKVTFSTGRPVSVIMSGAKPYLVLTLTDGTTRSAVYESGSGTPTLVFSYTVLQSDPAGVVVGNGSIVLPDGAHIKDSAGNSVNTTAHSDTLSAAGIQIDPNAAPLAVSDNSIDDETVQSQVTVNATRLTKNVILSGIGDGDDLRAKVLTAANEKWVPKIHKGWFYYQDQEYYLFAKRASVTIPNYNSGDPISLATSDEGYIVAKRIDDEPAARIDDTNYKISRESITSLLSVKINGVVVSDATYTVDADSAVITFASGLTTTDWVVVTYTYTDVLSTGPVFVKATIGGSTIPMNQVASSMVVCRSLITPTQIDGTNNYKYPISGIPVELYRRSMNTPMRSVPSIDAIQDVNEYCVLTGLDGANIAYHIVVSGQSPVYATYIDDSGASMFTQQEVCAVDSKLQVRATYGDLVSDGSTSPKVFVVDDGVLTELVAEVSAAGNVVTLPGVYTRTDGVSAKIKAGDRVGVLYTPNNVWTLKGNSMYAYSSAAIDSVTVEYEAAETDYWEGDTLPETSASYVQLNPLKDGVRSGFLYLVDDTTQKQVPTKLTLHTSPPACLVDTNTNKGQPIRLLARVADKDGHPVHGEYVRLQARGIQVMVKSSGDTDTVPWLPQTIHGAPVVIDAIRWVVNGVSYYFTAGTDYTVAFMNGSWVVTWLSGKRPTTNTAFYVNFTPAAGRFVGESLRPVNSCTDWRGEVAVLWEPYTASYTVFEAKLINRSPSLFRTIGCKQDSWTGYCDNAFNNDPTVPQKIHLVLTDQSDEPGTVKVLAYVTDITGTYPLKDLSVTWGADKGKFSSVSTVTNDDGVASNNYYPSDSDSIYVTYGSLHSNRLYIGRDTQ